MEHLVEERITECERCKANESKVKIVQNKETSHLTLTWDCSFCGDCHVKTMDDKGTIDVFLLLL